MQKEDIIRLTEEFRNDFLALREEIGKVIVGHKDVIDGVLTCLFAGGHVLLEGVPGLGKTMLVKTLSQVLSLPFSRIQFTPDLMPADIIGTMMVVESPGGGKKFEFHQGPIFANLILADEINRATPKTQSALLEAMQEKSVTVSGQSHILSQPFFVLATQNPIEMEGTYPLPEAQVDRFFFKMIVKTPKREELVEVLQRTTEGVDVAASMILNRERILQWIKLVRNVVIAPHVRDYASRIVLGTHPQSEYALGLTKKYLRYGSSPRGAQAIVLGAKIKALISKRYNVSFEDIVSVVKQALRHRIILNFEGEAEAIEPDAILDSVIEQVPKTLAQTLEKV